MTADLERWLRATGAQVTNNLPANLSGKWLTFLVAGQKYNNVHFIVRARRGQFVAGWVEWSPQWGAWSFFPHPECRLSLTMIAECYAFIKSLGGRQI